MTALDQPLHHLDHLGDVAGGARLRGRRQHTELFVGAIEGALVRGGPLPPRPARLGGLDQDLVLDIGDVADEEDVDIVREQPASQHVERDSATHVADVRLALHGGATEIHRSTAGDQGREIAHGPRVGVKEAQRHGSRS